MHTRYKYFPNSKVVNTIIGSCSSRPANRFTLVSATVTLFTIFFDIHLSTCIGFLAYEYIGRGGKVRGMEGGGYSFFQPTYYLFVAVYI